MISSHRSRARSKNGRRQKLIVIAPRKARDFAKQGKMIVVVGPTASGKSDLGIFLAQKLNGEIISADSRQVYRGMDIGTGKVTKREQKLVPHHLLDVANPKRQFTAEQFQKLGSKALRDILKRHKLPIIVGGTGFYIDALVSGQIFPSVPPNARLRAKLEKQTAEQLFEKLSKLDAVRAHSIDRHNKRRLIRALEIIDALGSVPSLPTTSPYDVLWLGITWPKEKLAQRIQKRLDARFRQGMIKEIQRLHDASVSWKRLEDFGLEYRWIARYLQKKIALSDMKKALFRDIVHYSKRQMTWFNRNKNISWVSSKSDALDRSRNFLAAHRNL